MIVPTASGADSLTFHWTPDRLPVRIWVEDSADMPRHVTDGVSAWRRGVTSSQFAAEIVSDSAVADVVVRVAPPPSGAAFMRARLGSAFALECEGATDRFFSPDYTELLLPVRVYVNPLTDPQDPGLEECLALTATHELGHTLGIWQHSDSTADIMFAAPTVSRPSDRDLGTVRLLYRQAPNVTPTGR
jgi:predicted Zn-dependent protease